MALVIRIYRIWLVLCSLSAAATGLYAQNSPFDPSMKAQAAMIQDQVLGFTDRSLYISGETIRFMARLQTTGLPQDKDWSRILYVELLSASGEARLQGKFRLRNRIASGEVIIPDGLLTGTYFLRLYTRWMRNRGPQSYCYIPLRIINPFSPELSAGIAEGNGELLLSLPSVQKAALRFSEASKPVSRGDSIGLDLDAEARSGSGKIQGCLTVVPAAALPQAPMLTEYVDPGETDSFHLSFLPDLHGATLSGTVLNPEEEEEPVPDTRIHFTLMGEQATYFTAHSDAYGKFSLTLPPREGKLELLVQPERMGTGKTEVRIDQDFDPLGLAIKWADISFDERERQAITIMARKHQLSLIYRNNPSVQVQQDQAEVVPFYGDPDFMLNMDDYVLLPTMEEVFINLVPGVTPLIRRNRTMLLMESINPAISMFPQLIMIDQVPLFSTEQFLSVSPAKISRIDVVDDVFIKGDMRFGGIINLHSREQDMAGIDLGDNSFFIDFQAMYPREVPLKTGSSPYDRMPDMRNTLLWIPELVLEGSESLSVSFIAPDYPGEYVALFQGWNELGELVFAEFSITIH